VRLSGYPDRTTCGQYKKTDLDFTLSPLKTINSAEFPAGSSQPADIKSVSDFAAFCQLLAELASPRHAGIHIR